MAEEILDASAIDDLNDYELTGDTDDLEVMSSEESSSEYSPEQDEDPQEQPDNYEETPDDDDNFTAEVLRLKGIQDPSKIKFEDESGAIIERSWNDLSTNEKLSILTLEEDADTDLEEEEINFINMLRYNNLTPSQYLQALQNNIIQNMQDNQPIAYEVDNLTDDELFALDLIEKLGEDNVTDEELQDAIKQAKTNADLYNKQVVALRDHYKDLENQHLYETEQMKKAQLEESYQGFSEQILNQIEGFEEIAGQEIELSVDDKNDIANYILTRDESGLTDFYKDLQNPQALTTAAFWVLKGPEIMQELQHQIQEAYKRGFAVGSSPRNTYKAPQVVVSPRTSTPKETVNNDASAAFGDDESYLYN